MKKNKAVKKKAIKGKKKKSSIKTIITISLFAFVAASALALVVKSVGKKEGVSAGENIKGTKVVVYYFHGTHRCWSCITIENYTKEALETGYAEELKTGKLEFKAVNSQLEGNKSLAAKYNAHTKSVILVLFKDGKPVKFEMLQDIWRLLRDKAKFMEYIQSNTKKYLDEAV